MNNVHSHQYLLSICRDDLGYIRELTSLHSSGEADSKLIKAIGRSKGRGLGYRVCRDRLQY